MNKPYLIEEGKEKDKIKIEIYKLVFYTLCNKT
jgi:hypothetical protein